MNSNQANNETMKTIKEYSDTFIPLMSIIIEFVSELNAAK